MRAGICARMLEHENFSDIIEKRKVVILQDPKRFSWVNVFYQNLSTHLNFA